MKRALVALMLSGCVTTGANTGPAPLTKAECPTTEPSTTEDSPMIWNARVAKVCLLGPANEELKGVLGLMKSQEGKALEPEVVSRSLRDFVATGFVSSAKAIATPAPENTAVLTYVVTLYPQVGEVKFVAGGKVDVGPSRNAAMKAAWASPVALARVKEDLVDTLHAQGFQLATVAMKTTRAGEKVNVEFVVNEGPQDTVTSIQFVGNKKLKEAELRKVLRSQMNAPWDVNTNTYDELALRDAYYDRGMITAQAKAATVRESTTGAVAVTFTITEGEVFTFGALTINGADQKLLKTLEAKSGKTFSNSVVRRDIAKLEASGEFTVTPQVNLDEKKKKVDLTFVFTKK